MEIKHNYGIASLTLTPLILRVTPTLITLISKVVTMKLLPVPEDNQPTNSAVKQRQSRHLHDTASQHNSFRLAFVITDVKVS